MVFVKSQSFVPEGKRPKIHTWEKVSFGTHVYSCERVYLNPNHVFLNPLSVIISEQDNIMSQQDTIPTPMSGRLKLHSATIACLKFGFCRYL